MQSKAIQDYYPEILNHCYGCGQKNSHGHQIKSFWEGDRAVGRFTPKPYHTTIPGFVYGGLIASLVDCHGTGTASAAAYKDAGRDMGTEPYLRFVTASLTVDYFKPTPIGTELEFVGTVEELKKSKVIVVVEVKAKGVLCARGRVISVPMPASMAP